MAKSTDLSENTDLKTNISLFMLRYLLPRPVIRRSYKLQLFTDQNHIKNTKGKKLPANVSEVQFIGSRYEGLTVTLTSLDGSDAIFYLSDYDLMPVLREYKARNIDISGRKLKVDKTDHVQYLEIHEASHPGYCTLKSIENGTFVGMRFNADCSGDVDIFQNEIEVGKLNIPYIDIIPDLSENPSPFEVKKYVHGPAISCTIIESHPGKISDTGQDVDIVLSIKCQSWPGVASQWFERVKTMTSEWPSTETIERVKEAGCYLVAVPHPLSPNPREEWRYSFAPSEKILARSLTFAQKGSYIIAKMLFKTVLANIEKISSYCLKTQMFWLCEEESSAWSYDKVGHYALKVLSKLADNLRRGVLRQYIIPENNIISHVPKSTLQEVSMILSELVRNPFPVLQKIRRTTKYFGIIVHPPEDSFESVVTLLETPTDDVNKITRCFQETKFAIVNHYCSLLNKPIVNFAQVEFSKLKFAILMDIAEDIGNDPDITETVDDMIIKIADKLSKFTEDNAKKWYAYVDEYRKTLEKVMSENVEASLPTTYEGILKVGGF